MPHTAIINLEVEELRRRCARFVQDNREKIASWQPERPAVLNGYERADFGEVFGRA